MSRTFIIIYFLFTLICATSAQSEGQLIGTVTFVTSTNVYVRFDNTDLIAPGDTLYLSLDTPCLLVEQKSSSSCVTSKIGNCTIKKGDSVVFKQIIQKSEEEIQIEELDPDSMDLDEQTPKVIEEFVDQEPEKIEQSINARISAASYSQLSNRADRDRHRTMLRANLNIDRINGSKFSLESYVNYRKNFIQGELPEGYRTQFLNVYNLALNYDIDSTAWLAVGRKINRRASSLGPIDGIMGEKHFGNFYTGAIVGFKPDLIGFGLNTDLFEYGVYAGHQFRIKRIYGQTTLGLLEQQNGSAIDRRYAYFQHSSSPVKKLNLFSSIELDLYQKVVGENSFNPRLTNLFVSAQYRFTKSLSLNVSYDARKRVIFYESLRTQIEELLADDQARQGIRARINFRPFRHMTLGVAAAKRYQSNSQNKAENFSGYLSYSKLPVIQGRISLNYNQNQSNYLKTKIYSLRYNRVLIPDYLDGDFYYRNVKYTYIGGESQSDQQYYGAGMSFRLSRSLRFRLLAEHSVRQTDKNWRINTKLIKRFRQ
jgi:hypothetical protein